MSSTYSVRVVRADGNASCESFGDYDATFAHAQHVASERDVREVEIFRMSRIHGIDHPCRRIAHWLRNMTSGIMLDVDRINMVDVR
jgi:hypothetical protein